MHLLFLTRGIKRDVEEVVKFLETQPFYMPYKTKDGKQMLQPIQGNLQPIQLWSYVFPEESKDRVFNGLLSKAWTFPKDRKMRAFIAGLRNVLKAEKIPDWDKTKKGLFLPDTALKNVVVVPIGVKYDVKEWFDPESETYHERL